jgi:hypothetical protein
MCLFSPIRYFQIFVLPLCAVFIFAAETASSQQPELTEDIVYPLPDFEGTIQKIYLHDANDDGVPEILASDGEIFRLFDPIQKSVIVEDTLRPVGKVISYNLICEDLNKDRAADLLVGVCHLQDIAMDFTLTFYSGLGDIQLLDTTISPLGEISPIGFGGGAGFIPSFKALDVDGDGFKEMFISVDSSSEETGSICLIGVELAGSTRIFGLYPYQVFWSEARYISNPLLLTADDREYLVYAEHSGSACEATASALTEHYSSHMALLMTTGSLMSATRQTAPGPKSAYDYYSSISREEPQCVGELIPGNDSPEVLAHYYGALSYDLYGEQHYDSQRKVRAYRVTPAEEFELLWEKSVDGHAAYVVCIPDLPGYYFGFAGGRFVQFDGSDGSEVASTTVLPEGEWFGWFKPFADDIPRFLTVKNDSLHLYRVEITTDADEESSPVPRSFSLGSPYPNPFNASQVIPLILARPGEVTVEVYNLTGQKVATPYSGYTVKGKLEIPWDASGLASGLYFIKASAASESAVRKVVLLK